MIDEFQEFFVEDDRVSPWVLSTSAVRKSSPVPNSCIVVSTPSRTLSSTTDRAPRFGSDVRVDESRGEIVFSCRDDGAGIPSGGLPSIFG